MKKLLATLLILVSIFTLAACNDVPDAGTTNSTSESTTETTANPTIVQTPPITYEVKYIGANGEETVPFEESMFSSDIQMYSNGEYSETTGDGWLAFYSVQNYLPQCVEKIPTVMLDENATIEITAREGVSFEALTGVDVYGKDGDAYKLLSEGMTLSEIVAKGQDEWKNEMLYLYFDVGFYDTGVSYNKSVRNGFFVKTMFADGKWGVDVRFKTDALGFTVPHTELIYMRTSHEGNLHVSDGALMFYETSEYLPEFAAKIPTVEWDEGFALVYATDEGITHKGGQKFSVYGEDFTVLAKAISRDELIERSKSDWQGKTVYLQFGGVFYHKINEEITEDMENAYFVKTAF